MLSHAGIFTGRHKQRHELTALKACAATIEALLVAKSVLVVEALPLARWFGGIVVVSILWRAFLFGLVVLAFRILERSLKDYLRQGNVKGIADFFGQSVSLQVLVEVGWIFVGMFGFCLIAQYCRLLGGDLVWKSMTRQRIEPCERAQ